MKQVDEEKLCGFFLSRELPVFCDLFLDSTAIALENFFTLRNLAKMGCMQRGLIAVKWGKTHFFLNTFLVNYNVNNRGNDNKNIFIIILIIMCIIFIIIIIIIINDYIQNEQKDKRNTFQ